MGADPPSFSQLFLARKKKTSKHPWHISSMEEGSLDPVIFRHLVFFHRFTSLLGYINPFNKKNVQKVPKTIPTDQQIVVIHHYGIGWGAPSPLVTSGLFFPSSRQLLSFLKSLGKTVATGFSTFMSRNCICLGRHNTHLCLYMHACSIYIYINTYIPVHHICIVFYDPKSPMFFSEWLSPPFFPAAFGGKVPPILPKPPHCNGKSPAAPIGQLGHVPHAVKNPTQPGKVWTWLGLGFLGFRSGAFAVRFFQWPWVGKHGHHQKKGGWKQNHHF